MLAESARPCSRHPDQLACCRQLQCEFTSCTRIFYLGAPAGYSATARAPVEHKSSGVIRSRTCAGSVACEIPTIRRIIALASPTNAFRIVQLAISTFQVHENTDQLHRFILADTDRLHKKITEMSDRIRQLEDALAILQSSTTRDMHPLLRPDLLGIKSGLELHSAINHRAAGQPTPQDVDEQSQQIDVPGTLNVRDDGAARFYGHSAGSEVRDESFLELLPVTYPAFCQYSRAYFWCVLLLREPPSASLPGLAF